VSGIQDRGEKRNNPIKVPQALGYFRIPLDGSTAIVLAPGSKPKWNWRQAIAAVIQSSPNGGMIASVENKTDRYFEAVATSRLRSCE
jgi:hypothetical protein